MQFGVDGGDLTLDLAQPLVGQALEQGRSMDMVAVGGRDPVFDQTTPGDEQLLHVAERLADDRPGLQRIESAEAGEHGGIDGVGLGALSDGFGKAPRLQRIDLDRGDCGVAELPFEGAMVGAGGLEDDAMDRALAEPGEEGFEPAMVLGNCRAVA